MEISFEQAALLFAMNYRKQQIQEFAMLFHNDGGPGSGNFGHEGRPGEVGGSAPAEYGGLSDEGMSVIKDHLTNPDHFGQSDEQRDANRQKLIRALSDIGVSVEHDEDYDTYSAVCADMSYEENVALNHALNQSRFLCGIDREKYVQTCREEGKPIRLHEKPTEVYDGWLWSKSGKRQTDGTPVYRDMTKEQILSDDDIVKYSGMDLELNPDEKTKAEKARDAAISSMNDAERATLRGYTKQWHGANYQAINGYLVTGEGTEQAKAAAETIKTALDHPIGVDCITCRGDSEIYGTGKDEAVNKLVKKIERGDYSAAKKLQDMLTGQTVTNKAAMSTSPNDPTSGYGQRPVQYIFRTPKEAKAVDITSISSFGGGRSEVENKLAATGLFGNVEYESEVLFKPGTQYKVSEVKYSMSIDRKGKKRGQVFIIADILIGNHDSHSDGGPGSGNHNHKGVPGQVGGSAPSRASQGELTDEERRNVYAYSNTYSETVNAWLRLERDWKSNTSLKDTIESIDSAVEKGVIDEDTTVYRGVSLESLGISQKSDMESLDGKTVFDRGFQSTSKREDVANSFVRRMKFSDGIEGTVIEIHLPKGEGYARDISDCSANGKYEDEVLLKRGIRMKLHYKDGKLKADILNANSSRSDSAEPQDWITINGTHVPLDESGEITGKIADKIKSGKSPEPKKTVSAKDLSPNVEYSERVEYWKKQIKSGNHRPILVDKNNPKRVIDGNHTLAAYKELGIEPEIYSMDRVEFLNGAAETDDTVEYIRNAIGTGKAERMSTEKSEAVTIGKEMQPTKTDYDYSDGDSEDDWIEKNVKSLMPIYKNGGSDAIGSEWRKFRMARTTEDTHEISKDDADTVIADHVSQSVFDGWFRNADSGYKPKLLDAMLSSKEMRNAGLSLAYENYKNCTDDPMPFDRFLSTPVTMYRGGRGQKHTKDDVFSAYTFDRKIAEKFAGKGGKITEAKIRPIDTYGSMRAVGEAEIWVPSEIAPNGNMDGREDGFGLLSFSELKYRFSKMIDNFRKSLAFRRQSDIVKSHSDHGVKGMRWHHRKGRAKNAALKMSKSEYSNVQHNVNTYYHSKGLDERIGKECGMYIDGCYYTFTNRGFDNYEFHQRIPIVGNEGLISWIEDELR